MTKIKLRIRQFIRSIVLRLLWWTDEWVVPANYYKLVDGYRSIEYSSILGLVERVEKDWAGDPECVRFATFVGSQIYDNVYDNAQIYDRGS